MTTCWHWPGASRLTFGRQTATLPGCRDVVDAEPHARVCGRRLESGVCRWVERSETHHKESIGLRRALPSHALQRETKGAARTASMPKAAMFQNRERTSGT